MDAEAVVPLEQLKNIGRVSCGWLRAVGFQSSQDLRQAGAVTAFLRIRSAGFRPSFNLLYALEGALLDCHWTGLPPGRRESLIMEVDARLEAMHQAAGDP
jgi:diadenosine tetraphosphatase ApaH/serine/threonine PP2A family protein phosphatase